MPFYIVFIIAISLSMDAFSLALAYGTLNISKKDMFILSLIVGIYHFFMPIIGMLVGNAFLQFFTINPNIIVTVVLCFIGIQMLIETFKGKEKVKILSKIEMLVFGFAVSVDSFSVGMGINLITTNYVLSSCLFSICSFLFTLLGLNIGKKINNLFGKISTIIGGLVLIIIGISYII